MAWSSIVEVQHRTHAREGPNHFHLGEYGVVGHVHLIASVAVADNDERVRTLAEAVDLVRTGVGTQHMSRIHEIGVALPPRDVVLRNKQIVKRLGGRDDGRNALEDLELASILLRKILQNRLLQDANGVQGLLIDVHTHFLCDRRRNVVPFVVLDQLG